MIDTIGLGALAALLVIGLIVAAQLGKRFAEGVERPEPEVYGNGEYLGHGDNIDPPLSDDDAFREWWFDHDQRGAIHQMKRVMPGMSVLTLRIWCRAAFEAGIKQGKTR